MSIFQQTRANIPVWVPSQRLLAELWSRPEEPNELSWTAFVEGSENQSHITSWDKARTPETTAKWASLADFYHTMGCVFEFESIEDLASRLFTVDYNSSIVQSEANQKAKREEIFSLWEQVFYSLRSLRVRL